MKIKIKKILIEEGVVDHLKNNWGKYATGAGAVGAFSAASNGYLGVDAQDAIQNLAGKYAGNLENESNYNNIKSNLDAGIEVFSRPDNLLTNWGNNEETYKIQKMIQPRTWGGEIQGIAANGIRQATSMDQSPDTANFIVRNPLVTAKLAAENIASNIKPFIGK